MDGNLSATAPVKLFHRTRTSGKSSYEQRSEPFKIGEIRIYVPKLKPPAKITRNESLIVQQTTFGQGTQIIGEVPEHEENKSDSQQLRRTGSTNDKR